MVNAVRKIWVALLVGVMLTAGGAGVAQAVDAPKWVAVLYVDAQRAVGLRWMPVQGATGYKVLRSETAGTGYAEIAATPQPQHFDTAVEPGSTYYYVLQAVAGADVSANGDEKTVKIPGKKKETLIAPAVSRALAQSATEFGKTTYKVSLFWDRTQGAIAYNVYRTTTKGEGYEMVASVPENQFFDTTVEGGTTYYYALSALDTSFQETERSADKEVLVKKSTAKRRVKKIRLKVQGRAADLLWFTQTGAGGGEFDYKEATDVAFSDDSNQVVAVGNTPKMIYVLDGTTGEYITKFGGKGTDPGKLLDPVGLDLDADDNVVVVDRMRSILSIFTLGGNFIREIALPKAVPPGITVDPPLKKGLRFQEVAVDHDTGDFYVVEANNSRIWVLDEGGTVQRIWGDPGYDVGQLNGPLYIRFDPDGNLATANLVSTRISTFSKEGEHLRSFGIKKAQVGGFVFMAGFDFDKEGNILVLDKASATLQAFLPDGRYLYNMANEAGDGGASLYTPKSVAISNDNRVFAVEGLVDIVKGFQITGAVPEPQQPPPEKKEAAE